MKAPVYCSGGRQKTTCPKDDLHTPQPAGYVAWHEWAERMSKTHGQQRCDGCGLLQIWVPRVERFPSGPEEAP